MSSAIISRTRIVQTKWLGLAVATVLAVGLMVLWWTRGSSPLPLAHSAHKGEQGIVTNSNKRRANATQAGTGDLKEKETDRLSNLDTSGATQTRLKNLKILGENGRITTKAIEDLNLTREETAALTKVFSTVKEQAEADFVSRTQLTEKLSTEDGGFRHTYFVKARPDRGAEFSNALAKGFEALIGPDRAQRINSNITSLNFLGGAGKYDLNIVIFSHGGEKIVKCERIDPTGGRVLGTQECSFTSFSETFGNVFSY